MNNNIVNLFEPIDNSTNSYSTLELSTAPLSNVAKLRNVENMLEEWHFGMSVRNESCLYFCTWEAALLFDVKFIIVIFVVILIIPVSGHDVMCDFQIFINLSLFFEPFSRLFY